RHRQEERGVGAASTEASFKVPLKRCSRGWVQRNQARLPELRVSHDKPVTGDVVELKAECFRDAEPSTDKEREERHVGFGPHRILRAEVPRRFEEFLDLIGGEDVRTPSS